MNSKNIFINLYTIFIIIGCSKEPSQVEVTLGEKEILFKLEETWENKRIFNNDGRKSGVCGVNEIDFTETNTLPYSVMHHFSLDTLRIEFIPNNRINGGNNLSLGFNRSYDRQGRQYKYEESLNVPKHVKYIELINFQPEKKIQLTEGRITSLPITYNIIDENDNVVYQPIIYYESNVDFIEVIRGSLFYSRVGDECLMLTDDEINQVFFKGNYNADDFITDEILMVDDKVSITTKTGGAGGILIKANDLKVGDYIMRGYKKYRVVEIVRGASLDDDSMSTNNQTSTPSDGVSAQSQDCDENEIIEIINSFKEKEINTTFNFPFGEYNLFQRYGGSIPSGGTFNGISFLTVDFFSDSNQIDNGIWVSYSYREDNGELIFGYVGRRSTDASGEVSWSNVRRYYAPTYESDGQENYETNSICDFWDKMNSYVETL